MGVAVRDGAATDARMTDDPERYDRAVSTLSRRQALVGGATLLTAGGTLVWVSDDAHAQVSVDELTIPDADFTSDSLDPVIDVTAAYDYDAGTQAVSRLDFALTVGGDVVAREELITDRTAISGETQLSGRVTDSDTWAVSDFSPDVAASVDRELTVGLTFAVVGTDDTVIVEDTASETVTVSVSHPQETKWTATVGGSGEVRTATPSE
jgi:hypothetical protein